MGMIRIIISKPWHVTNFLSCDALVAGQKHKKKKRKTFEGKRLGDPQLDVMVMFASAGLISLAAILLCPRSTSVESL